MTHILIVNLTEARNDEDIETGLNLAIQKLIGGHTRIISVDVDFKERKAAILLQDSPA